MRRFNRFGVVDFKDLDGWAFARDLYKARRKII